MNLGSSASHRMLDKSRYRLLAGLFQQGGEIFPQMRIGGMTGGVPLTVFEQLIEAFLSRTCVVKRHTIRQRDQAREIGGAGVFAMTAHVDLGRIRSKGTGVDVDFIVTHCIAD